MNEATKREAAEYLKAIEQMAEVLSNTTEQSGGTTADEHPFTHLGSLAQEKYGPGGHLAIGLVIMGLTSMCYFQGKIDEEDFQAVRPSLPGLVKKLLALTGPSKGAMH